MDGGTGKEVEMVERIAKLQLDDNEDPNRISFLQVRLIGPEELRRSKKPPKAKEGDKNLKFSSSQYIFYIVQLVGN